MTMQLRPALAFTMFTALVWPGAAMAQDVPPAAAAFLKTLEIQYSTVPAYKSIEGDGDSVTIEGLTLAPPADGASKLNATIDSIKLEGISDQGGGLFEIKSGTYSGLKISMTDPNASFTLETPEMELEGIYVATMDATPTPQQKLRASMAIARKATSGKITLVAGGQTITADSYTANWDGDPVTGTGKSDMKISNVVVPETVLALADQTGVMKGMGYTSLTMEIGGGGDMTNDGQNFGFNGNVYYTVNDMGTLRVALDVADMPMSFIEAVQQMKPNDDGAALVPHAQGISFGGMSLRFEDQSITNKVLPLVAQMNGMDVNTAKGSAGAIAQLGMAQLNSPDFTKQVVDAINAYLADPKSITVTAKPAQRVTVGQLMTVNPQDPASIIKLLGADVTAND